VPARDIAGDGLPAIADTLVIGSGYTGLSAALELARAGRATVVSKIPSTPSPDYSPGIPTSGKRHLNLWRR